MARTWVKPSEGTDEGHPRQVDREGGSEDPRGVLLSVERLVLSAGESVRRIRRVQSISRQLGNEWADDETLEEMVTELDEVRVHLAGLRAHARQACCDRPDPEATRHPGLPD